MVNVVIVKVDIIIVVGNAKNLHYMKYLEVVLVNGYFQAWY